MRHELESFTGALEALVEGAGSGSGFAAMQRLRYALQDALSDVVRVAVDQALTEANRQKDY